MKQNRRPPRRRSRASQLTTSVAVATACVGLIGLSTVGSSDDEHDPFPHSVLAPAD